MPERWKNNRICSLLGIHFPVIQGGMIYNSGARLAAAVAEAGGLGLIGAGSMRPDLFRDQIHKAKALTGHPFGVNIPLLYPHSQDCVEIALAEEMKIFFTSAGSPKKVIAPLKEAGCTVVHVVASPALAVKCQAAGCDAVVCEGFEAGGHNGREEITTMVLVPECVAAVDIPVIAAGGIMDGRGLVAAHAADVIHRDFKPDNVLVSQGGRVLVTDFGLARAGCDSEDDLRDDHDRVSLTASNILDTPLTRTGAVVGTPAYMAPEQFRGAPIDARSDLFSFCVTLHEALYGERPFAGDNLADLERAVQTGAVRSPPDSARVPTHIQRALARGLAVRPDDRQCTLAELLEELARDPWARRARVAA